jgi:hypothetical protein
MDREMARVGPASGEKRVDRDLAFRQKRRRQDIPSLELAYDTVGFSGGFRVGKESITLEVQHPVLGYTHLGIESCLYTSIVLQRRFRDLDNQKNVRGARMFRGVEILPRSHQYDIGLRLVVVVQANGTLNTDYGFVAREVDHQLVGTVYGCAMPWTERAQRQNLAVDEFHAIPF